MENSKFTLALMKLCPLKQTSQRVTAVRKDTMLDLKMAPTIQEEAKNLCHTCREMKFLVFCIPHNYPSRNFITDLREMRNSHHFRAVMSLYTQKAANVESRVKSMLIT